MMTEHNTALPERARASQVDPLVTVVGAYYAGLADFKANAPEDDDGADAYAAVSYQPHMEQLEKWTAPAISRAGAISALKVVLSSTAVGDTFLVPPMAQAAIAFLSKGAVLAPRLSYMDLESELHDAVNMSAISCDLLERADGNGFKNVDWEILLFAVYHSNSLLLDLKRRFDGIHDSNVAAEGGRL